MANIWSSLCNNEVAGSDAMFRQWCQPNQSEVMASPWKSDLLKLVTQSVFTYIACSSGKGEVTLLTWSNIRSTVSSLWFTRSIFPIPLKEDILRTVKSVTVSNKNAITSQIKKKKKKLWHASFEFKIRMSISLSCYAPWEMFSHGKGFWNDKGEWILREVCLHFQTAQA